MLDLSPNCILNVDQPFDADVNGKKTTVEAGHRIQIETCPKNPNSRATFVVLGIAAKHAAHQNVIGSKCSHI